LRDLPKRAFEYLYGLAALNEILVVQNHSWHCVNASILIKLLARPNLSRELVGIEYLTGAFPVQSNACCNVLEHLEVAWIEAFSKVGDKQCHRCMAGNALAATGGPFRIRFG